MHSQPSVHQKPSTVSTEGLHFNASNLWKAKRIPIQLQQLYRFHFMSSSNPVENCQESCAVSDSTVTQHCSGLGYPTLGSYSWRSPQHFSLAGFAAMAMAIPMRLCSVRPRPPASHLPLPCLCVQGDLHLLSLHPVQHLEASHGES